MPRYILLHSTASTNTYLSKMAMMLPSGTVIHTPHQSEGRGQRGNSWESESGKNALFSMLIKKPAVPVASQFAISEAVAVAIVEVLSQYCKDISIKWPNDIYYQDRKLSGILIEHSVMGSGINHTIIGVGLNVNQTVFLSDAPNPVSLAQILGKELPVDEVMHKVCEAIKKRCAFESYGENEFASLHRDFMSHLYRYDDKRYPFMLPNGECVNASIADVERSGMLVLEYENGEKNSFAFKEIAFVINNNL